MATLKRLKQGDDNELKRNLRLEKVDASKQLRLAVETEEERRTRLENDAAILKSWQLCLSFKLDVLTIENSKNTRNELAHPVMGTIFLVITKESVNKNIGIGSPILYYIRDPGVPIFTKGFLYIWGWGPHNNMNIGMGSPSAQASRVM